MSESITTKPADSGPPIADLFFVGPPDQTMDGDDPDQSGGRSCEPFRDIGALSPAMGEGRFTANQKAFSYAGDRLRQHHDAVREAFGEVFESMRLASEPSFDEWREKRDA